MFSRQFKSLVLCPATANILRQSGYPCQNTAVKHRLGDLFTIRHLSSAPRLCSAHLTVTPQHSLFDEDVTISAGGLPPLQPYTISCQVLDSKGVPFLCVGHYRSDEAGSIDVTKQASQGGYFRGVQPMGLIANIRAQKSAYKHHRFSFKDVTRPLEYELNIYEDYYGPHISVLGAEKLGLEPVATTSHVRTLMAPGVRQIPVREGRIRGVLYLPEGPGPHPGVIDMFGSAGGCMQHRSAMLASRGIASFALAFFGYEDLPDNMREVDLDYFREAVDFLSNREEILGEHVGAISVSKGGDLILNMAVHLDKVRAVVPINSCISNVESELTLPDGTIQPGLNLELGRVLMVRDGSVDPIEMLNDPVDEPETIVPVEKIKGSVLWLVGEEDLNWKSGYFADLAAKRLQEKGTKGDFEFVKYPGAGHLIEPPYVPFCEVSYHKMVQLGMLWGGRDSEHCEAQRDSWQRILTFFRTKLDPSNQ